MKTNSYPTHGCVCVCVGGGGGGAGARNPHIICDSLHFSFMVESRAFRQWKIIVLISLPGPVAQSVASLVADPGSLVRSQLGPIFLWRLIMKYFLQSFSTFH